MVQVDKFKVPMDFVLLEMTGALLRHKGHMIFLSRPFIVATKTVIDVQNEKLTMTFSDETVELKAIDLLQYPFLLFIHNTLLSIL